MTVLRPSALRPRARRLSMLHTAVAGVLAAGALAGSVAAFAHDPAGDIDTELAHGHVDQAIALGEAAVAANPRDAGLRVELGRAYMRAGRFESAASILADAQALGSTSGRTALDLALAEIACGKGRDALAVLDAAREDIPASDFGLAVALAGDPARGVAVLTDDLRSGDRAPTLRQNLGYADALDGRWADARLIASIDLAPDQLDARLQQWAVTAQPEAFRQRVATLLGVPLREDAGAPTTLTLAAPQAPAPASAAPMAQMASAAPAPIAAASSPASPVTSEPAAESRPMAMAMESVPVIEKLPAPAVAEPALPRAMRIAAATHAIVPEHRAHERPAAAHAAVPAYMPVEKGDHFVQLGAFDSAAMAEHARQTFTRNPALARHPFVITQAVVNGRNYWRVAASGFDTASASGTCGAIRHHGGLCFAYAAAHAPAGAVLAMANTQGLIRHR